MIIVAAAPYLLAGNFGVSVKAVKEFKALTKAKPGQLNYAYKGVELL